MSALRINISKLSEGEHRYPFEIKASEIGLGDEFAGKLTVEAVIQKSPRQVFLRVEAETSGTFVCDRCLDSLQKTLKAQYVILYVVENQGPLDEEIETEVQTISPDTNYLDLDEDVRQFVMLSVPHKLLCRDECKGLCAGCGKNLNYGACECAVEDVDPRWNALKKLNDR